MRSLSSRIIAGAALAASLFGGVPDVLADSKSDARRAFNEGMRAIDRGRVREGIALLERAYATLPHPSVLFNIARAYASIGELEAAIRYFEGYLDSNPDDAEPVSRTLEALRTRNRLRNLVDRGLAAVRRGRHLEGVGYLREAYQLRPNPAVLYNIARAYEDAGLWDEAAATFGRYLASNPQDAPAVRARLSRLNARREASEREARAESGGAGPPPARVERRRGRRPPRATERRTEDDKEDEEPSQPSLSEAQVQSIADAVLERLRLAPSLQPEPNEAPSGPPDAPLEPPASSREARVGTGSSSSNDVAFAEEPDEPASTLSAEPLELEAKGDQAYEDVVVTASRRPQSPLEAPNAVTIITAEEIRRSGAPTIPDLLRRVPGFDVMAMSYTDYNVAARGFNRRLANKLLVLVDGQTAYLDFLGFTSWRTLPVEMLDIERIEVVRGPGSAAYGAYAYTGIVNIITKRPKDIDGATAQFSAGNGEIVEGSFQYGGRSGELAFRFSGGYQRAEKYEIDFDESRPDVVSDLSEPATSLELGRFNGLVEYYLPTDEPSFLYLGGSFVQAEHEFFSVAGQRNLFASGPEGQVRAGFESERFTLRSFFFRVSKDSQSQSYGAGLSPLPSRAINDIISIEPIFQPEFELAGRHRLVIGGEYRFKSIEWDYLRGDRTENHFAVYFQDDWSINPVFSVLASARLDIHPLIGSLGSPRLALIFKPSPRQSLRLSLGTAFRVPTMAETYLSLASPVPTAPGTAVTLLGGGDDLDPENIATVDLGYRFESDGGEFEVVGYLNRVTNLIVRSPLESTGLEPRFLDELGALEVAQSEYINEDDAYLAVGAELDAHWFFVEGLDVGASYSFQYIVNEDTGDRFTDSPLHKASVWSQFRTDLGLDLGVSAHFVSDQDWIEREFDTDSPTGFDETPLPLDPTFTVLARVGYRAFDDRLEFALSGFNLVDVADARQRQHPFGNRLEARVLGSVTGRF